MAKVDIYEDLPEEVVNELLEEQEEKKNNGMIGNLKVLKSKHDERQRLRAEAEHNITVAMSKRAVDAAILEADDPKAQKAAQDVKCLGEACKVVNDNRTFVSKAIVPAAAGALGAAAVIITEKATRTGLVGTARDGVSSLVRRMIKKT